MPEEIALFIDFENIRYSMLNIQRREPDPQELIAVARRYGTVMVARAYADWSRQPEPFKGSLTAAMIDRVDCPAKQRDRIRMGTIHYSGNSSSGPLGSTNYISEQNAYPSNSLRSWANGMSSNSGSLPAIQFTPGGNGWSSETDAPALPASEFDPALTAEDQGVEEGFDDDQRDYRSQSPSGPLGPISSNTGHFPAVNPNYGGTGHHPAVNAGSTGNTGHLPAVNGSNTIVQSTVVQSTVDLNMLMDIIETVFDRPTITTFVLMTGDKDFTRISARLKLRLNKTVIVVGIPGTVSRDLISSASQFVPLVPGSTGNTGALPAINGNTAPTPAVSTGNTGAMPAVSMNYSSMGNTGALSQFQPPYGSPPMDVLDPQFLQFLDYIDRNWSWRTVIGVSNFIGDPINPKNRFRGRLTRESARELLNTCIQQGILLLQADPSGAEDLRLNRMHPGVDEVLKQFVR